MSGDDAPTTEDVPTVQRHRSAQELDAIGWALFFIWVGFGLLLDVVWGVGLLGVGVIILAGQIARKQRNLTLDGTWMVCGSLFLLGGLWTLFGVTIPLVPVLLIGAGAVLLFSTLKRKPEV